MNRRPRAILDLLRSNPSAASCLERQGQEERLLSALRDQLTTEARPHLLSGSRSGDTLVVGVDSPAWATRIRLSADALSATANRTTGGGISRVRVRIRPPDQGRGGRTAIPSSRRQAIRPATAEHLLAAADHCDDPGLAAALRRLAFHHLGDSPPGAD